MTQEQQTEVDRLQQEAKDNPSSAALLTLKVSQIYNQARLSSKIVLDGITHEEGAGLGRLSLAVGILGTLFVIPAAGILGNEERKKWRWSALTAGLGLGAMMVGMTWVACILRVSEPLLVSGAGAFLTMVGGFFLFASCRGLLSEFHRKKVYNVSAIGVYYEVHMILSILYTLKKLFSNISFFFKTTYSGYHPLFFH